MRRFELVEGSASKFWEIEQADSNELNIRWGRIGTAGQSQTKSFADAEKAKVALDKLIKEKTGKGYAEVSVAAGVGIGRTEAAPPAAVTAPPPRAIESATPVVAPPAEHAIEAAQGVAGAVPPWLAQGEPWLDDARARAYASRRHPQAVSLPDPVANWELVRQAHSVDDLGESDEELLHAAQRVADRLELRAPGPDAQADALLLAWALGTTGYDGENESARAIIDQLVMCYGLEGAVDVYLAAQRIQISMFRPWRLSFVVETPLTHWNVPLGDGEERLRCHLAAAPLAQWQVCVERMAAALPSLHPSRQPAVALLLPDQPALSNSLALSLAAGQDVPGSAAWLMLTITDPASRAALAKAPSLRFRYHRRMLATVMLEHGAAAAVDWLELADGEEALTWIGTPEAVTALAKMASASKDAMLRRSVERWPLAALVALARLVGRGKYVSLLMPRLTRLLSEQRAKVDALRPWLDNAAQGVIDPQLSVLAGPVVVAGIDELPGVLAAPPWLSKVRKQVAGVLTLEPLPLAAVERWAPGAKDLALAKVAGQRTEVVEYLGFTKGPLSVAAAKAIEHSDAQGLIEAWREMVAERKKARYYWFTLPARAVLLLPAQVGVPFWNAIAGGPESRDIDPVLATHGLAVLPGLVTMVRNNLAENLMYAQHFGAVELALPAARAFAKLKTLRALGRDWLLNYPEHAACGLIPLALGKRGEARDCAGSALRQLHARGHEALLYEVAGRYGDESVVAALRAVLEESPLDRFPAKRSQLPDWWQPRGWRRPLLLNGKALPHEAVDHLGQMLSFPTVDEVYGGIAMVKEACQGESLADFAWDMFSAWMEAGGPSKEGWGLTALGWLGNDETARCLTPFIRAWPGESAHARAVTGLDVLAAIGSDVALMMLNGIAQKVKFKGLQDKAREKIDAIAEARGLSTEELEDRLAPDFGLNEGGTLLLDFGPRAFTVAFDESLKPYVREVAEGGAPGPRLPDLPKPKKTDDEAMAKQAVERFKLLKKDVRTVASQQLLRLEMAMCARRRWAPELFRMFLVEHPLVRYIVQRLIWGVYEVAEGGSYGGALVSCFRVAEDGSFANAQDDTFQLPEGQNLRIGVPHALEIPAADVAAFGQVFADYELLQPFAQIGRDTYTLTEDEKKELRLLRWSGTKVPTGKVLGLANKGWRRGRAQDGGGIWYFTKPLSVDKVIELYLDPGIIVGLVDEYPEQTLGEVQVGQPSAWGEIRHPDCLATLDVIAASELIRDLEALKS